MQARCLKMVCDQAELVSQNVVKAFCVTFKKILQLQHLSWIHVTHVIVFMTHKRKMEGAEVWHVIQPGERLFELEDRFTIFKTHSHVICMCQLEKKTLWESSWCPPSSSRSTMITLLQKMSSETCTQSFAVKQDKHEPFEREAKEVIDEDNYICIYANIASYVTNIFQN